MDAFDIRRNDIPAALAVYVSMKEDPSNEGREIGPMVAVLWQLQDDPTELIAALREVRKTGQVPVKYRARVDELLHATAA